LAAVADLRIQITQSIIGAGLLEKAFAGIADALESAGRVAIDTNARLEQARIGFGTMLGGAQQADAFLREMAAFAAATPFSFPDLLDASKRMLAMGFAADEVKPLLTAVGDAVSAMGGGAGEIDRVTLALGQMQAKTKVSAEEMNQLTEVGIPGWRLLAEAMGITVAEAQKLAEQGKVSADVFIAAFQEFSKNNYGDMMAKQARTFQGAMSTIQDSLQMALQQGTEPFFESLSDLAVSISDLVTSDEFGKWINGVAESAAELSKILKEELTPAFTGLKESVSEGGTALGQLEGLFKAIDIGLRVLIPQFAAMAANAKGAYDIIDAGMRMVMEGGIRAGLALRAVAAGDFDEAIRQAGIGLDNLGREMGNVGDAAGEMYKANHDAIQALIDAPFKAAADVDRLSAAFARGTAEVLTTGQKGEVDAFIRWLAARTGLALDEAAKLLETHDLSGEYAVFKAQRGRKTGPAGAAAAAAPERDRSQEEAEKALARYRDQLTTYREQLEDLAEREKDLREAATERAGELGRGSERALSAAAEGELRRARDSTGREVDLREEANRRIADSRADLADRLAGIDADYADRQEDFARRGATIGREADEQRAAAHQRALDTIADAEQRNANQIEDIRGRHAERIAELTDEAGSSPLARIRLLDAIAKERRAEARDLAEAQRRQGRDLEDLRVRTAREQEQALTTIAREEGEKRADLEVDRLKAAEDVAERRKAAEAAIAQTLFDINRDLGTRLRDLYKSDLEARQKYLDDRIVAERDAAEKSLAIERALFEDLDDLARTRGRVTAPAPPGTTPLGVITIQNATFEGPTSGESWQSYMERMMVPLRAQFAAEQAGRR
jgi:tape measure domain-containing protein